MSLLYDSTQLPFIFKQNFLTSLFCLQNMHINETWSSTLNIPTVFSSSSPMWDLGPSFRMKGTILFYMICSLFFSLVDREENHEEQQ